MAALYSTLHMIEKCCLLPRATYMNNVEPRDGPSYWTAIGPDNLL